MLEYFIYRIIMFLSLKLPLRLGYWIALRIADLHYLLDHRGREAVKNNLRTILENPSEEKIRFEARWVFRNFGKYLVEFFRFDKFDHKFVEIHTIIKGEEYLQEVLKEKKGAIMVTAHLSNWEYGAVVLRYKGYKINVVAQMHRNPQVNRLFLERRKKKGIEVFSTAQAPLKVLKALKNNEIVAILADRDTTGGGIEIEFFGKKLKVPQGPARFSLYSGAPILPSFISRRPNDGFLLHIYPPIYPVFTESRQKTIQELTLKYMKKLEEAIKTHPSEWSNFYDVWK